MLLHAGGAKGKALLDAARKVGAREVACPKMTKPGDRLAFVRGEFRTLGRSATPEACQALVDAIGSDLRELAAAASQLVADVEGTIDEAVVGRYYTGRAEASSFEVADRAVEGRTAEALEALRWSLATGVAPVLITSALAQGCGRSGSCRRRGVGGRGILRGSWGCRRGRSIGCGSRCGGGRRTGWLWRCGRWLRRMRG